MTLSYKEVMKGRWFVYCDGVLLAKVHSEEMAQKLCEFSLPMKEVAHG
jgi:hypothetical protein